MANTSGWEGSYGTGGQRRERYPRNPTHCSTKKVLLKVLMAARTWGEGWSGRSRNLGEGIGGEASLGIWEERPRGSCPRTAHPRRGGYACPRLPRAVWPASGLPLLVHGPRTPSRRLNSFQAVWVSSRFAVLTPSPTSKPLFSQSWMMNEHVCVWADDLANRFVSSPALSCPFNRGKG